MKKMILYSVYEGPDNTLEIEGTIKGTNNIRDLENKTIHYIEFDGHKYTIYFKDRWKFSNLWFKIIQRMI